MIVLDIDLDAFVRPVAYHRPLGAGRLSAVEHKVQAWTRVERFLRSKGLLDGTQRGFAVERHHEVVKIVQGEIDAHRLITPLTWIHLDPHDDVGDGCQGNTLTPSNFMCECIRRGWIGTLVMVQSEPEFPEVLCSYVGKDVFVKGTQTQLTFKTPESLMLDASPDIVLLARSPEYTPATADALFAHIKGLFREVA